MNSCRSGLPAANKYNVCFTKTVASGNDFIIIDNKNGELDTRDFDYSQMAQDLCRRKFSIGADGLLVLEDSDKASFRMRIINPDGSEVQACGNGARCSAFYGSNCGWAEDLTIETGSGILSAWVNDNNVKLKMTDPVDIKLEINLGIGQSVMVANYINTGVPHVVHIVEDLEGYQVKEIGRKIREHTLFAPDGTNVNFVADIDKNSVRVRTYERGVEDETLACGTGTVASGVILGLLGYVSSPVKIQTKSGEIVTVHFKASGKKVTDVYLEGEARIVYEGKI